MKHFRRFKGLIFIALAISVTTQGSIVPSSESGNTQQEESSSVYNISVSSGQAQANQASANLTISGENSKVSVEKGGTVNLSAAKSIILRPGTKVTAGGFLYASIDPASKSGKRSKKEVRLVTVEENKKIEEQASLSFAYNLFSPFPSQNQGRYHAEDAENGSYTSSNQELFGVTPVQQREIAGNSNLVAKVTRNQLNCTVRPVPETPGYRAETMRVLRL